MDIDSPAFRIITGTIGLLAAAITIVTVAYQVIKSQPVPWWVLVSLVVGLIGVYLWRLPSGDFVIKSRAIVVDIRTWGAPSGAHIDETTTYRRDLVQCRKKEKNKLVYDEFASVGPRVRTDVISFPFVEKPKELNPKAADLVIDLGPNCRYGKKYEVVTRSEYTNTFPNNQSEYYEIRVSYPTKLLSVMVLLPKEKPCTSAHVKKIVGATEETVSPPPRVTDNKRIIVWTRRRPDFNAKFQIFWNW